MTVSDFKMAAWASVFLSAFQSSESVRQRMSGCWTPQLYCPGCSDPYMSDRLDPGYNLLHNMAMLREWLASNCSLSVTTTSIS